MRIKSRFLMSALMSFAVSCSTAPSKPATETPPTPEASGPPVESGPIFETPQQVDDYCFSVANRNKEVCTIALDQTVTYQKALNFVGSPEDFGGNMGTLCRVGNPFACSFVNLLSKILDLAAYREMLKTCSEQQASISCDVLRHIGALVRAGCDEGNSPSCYQSASIAAAFGDQDSVKMFLDRAVQLGNSDAIELYKLADEKDSVDQLHAAAHCGASAYAVLCSVRDCKNKKEIRPTEIADAALQCNQEKEYTAIRLGRFWVLFKFGGAFFIMDQKNFNSPCFNQYEKPVGENLCN